VSQFRGSFHLFQDGASLAYVKDQMGHSSIQVTVDTYGHLVAGGDIKWIDGLDSQTSAQPSATPAQPDGPELEEIVAEVVEKTWLPPRDSNPDMLIQSCCYAVSAEALGGIQ
jgi:hypothetical protein